MDTDVCKQIAWALSHDDDSQEWFNRRLGHLSYAFCKVRPTRHVEYAFCVWAGTRYEPSSEKVDEFCYRREEEAPQQSPYSIVDPSYWKIPDTLGVFVFREQFFVLLSEIADLSYFHQAPALVKDIYSGRCAFDEFCGLLTKKYVVLSDEEKRMLYEAIASDFGESMPYYYCSAIVGSVTM